MEDVLEDVLEVYARPRDPERPLVCLDETSKPLIAETRTPQPATHGRPARVDYEYARNGTANLFMVRIGGGRCICPEVCYYVWSSCTDGQHRRGPLACC
jgi:hypothetical protein